MHIRPLKPDDRDQWAALWEGYLAYYETTLPAVVYESSFARLLGDDPQDFHGLVAEENGELIGLVHYLFHRHGWKIENVCYLQDLYTAPTARGKGVASALIEAVYAEADKHAAPNVYWLTQEFNHTARRLYDKIGAHTPFIKYQRP